MAQGARVKVSAAPVCIWPLGLVHWAYHAGGKGTELGGLEQVLHLFSLPHVLAATPTPSGFEGAVLNFVDFLYSHLGYAGIVLAMALESCCIPLPSEIVMPLAGFFVLHHPDRFTLPGVALAGAVGCVIGSIVAYGIGASGGRPLLL